MADNITLITPTGGDTGEVVATDEIGSTNYQIIKVAFGALETANLVTSTATNPFPVALSDVDNAVLDAIAASVAGTLTVSGTVTANLGATDNAVLDAIAASVAGTLTVDLGANNDVTVTSGTVTANLGATDNAVLDAIAASVAGTLTVDLGANNDVTVTSGTIDLGATDNAVLDAIAASVAGTLTVSGTVTANLSATDNAVLDAIAAAFAAEGAALGSGALMQGDDGTDRTNVLVDTDGHLQVDVLSGGGGGTQYTEDDVAAANPVGTTPVLVRQDTPAGLVSLDGDVVGQRATNFGAAFVQILDSSGNFINTFGGSGGTSATDDAAFTAGAGTGTPAMGFFSADTVNAGDAGVLAMDASRRLLVSLEVDNASPVGGGTEAAAIRVTLASDSTGQVTIDGTVTANLSATDNAVLDAIAASVAGTLTVDLGANNDVTVTSGSITADLGANNDVTIDGSNSVYTHDAAGGTANGIMGMSQRDDEVGSTAISTTDGDAQSLRSDRFGALKTTGIADATSEIRYGVINTATSGDNQLLAAAGAGIKYRILSLLLVARGTVNARFESGAGGTAMTGVMNLVVNTGFALDFNPGGWFETGDNATFNLELSAAINVDGCYSYVLV